MGTGIHVTAPRGYMAMRMGQSYTLLRSCRVTQRVLLITFIDAQRGKGKNKTGRRAELAILPRDRYEAGLVPHRAGMPASIVPVENPSTLPPWLHDLEGIQFESEERWTQRPIGNRERKLSPLEEAERRLLVITPALKRVDDILTSDRPDYVLNCIARSCGRHVNETRFRTWFYCYIAFGYRIWALLPPRTEWGKWDRLHPDYADSCLGRPAIHLEQMFAGRTDQSMIDAIITGFRRHAGKCDNLTEIWATTVLKDFGGHVHRKPGEKPRAVHPKGNPLPSFDRFYYYIHKHIGADDIRRTLYGDRRIDYQEEAVRGSHSEDLDNVGERAHFDSSQIKEFPKSYYGSFNLPALHSVDLVDGMTGQISGIGHSLAAEESRAYKLALFCAAIKKSKFGEIIGLPISDDDWPGHGLPAALFTDNGPGASDEVRRAIRKWPISVESSPSHDPRANSTVETKHSRKKKQMGGPTHRLSEHTVIELIWRNVRRVIAKNRSDDVSARVPDRAVVEFDVKTPNDLHAYLSARHRSSVIHIPFEEAVRAFLDPVKLVTKKGRLYFNSREYSSDAVFTTGLGRHIRQSTGVKLQGYVYPLVAKCAWLEFDGKLIEVYSKATGTDALASVPELEEIEKIRSRASGARQAEAKVEVLAAHAEHRAHTNRDWHSHRTVRGRPKVKTKAALDEVRRLKSLKNDVDTEAST